MCDLATIQRPISFRNVWPGGCQAGCLECRARVRHTEPDCQHNRAGANPECAALYVDVETEDA